jgi:hypothetical protein
MEELKPTDIVTENKVAFVKTLKNQTGYPDNLTAEQICRMIYFFGARKLARKAVRVDGRFNTLSSKLLTSEKLAIGEIFKWYGYKTPDERSFSAAYNAVTIKFKEILAFLKAHPAFITTEIYQALQTAGYTKAIQNVVLVIDENRKVVPRLVNEKSKTEIAPLGKMETLLWEIQSTSLDKLMMILQNITIKDIQRANLGSKAKALRDIYAMVHMAKQTNKNPNLTLINLNVNTAEPKEKLGAYSDYLAKNRET